MIWWVILLLLFAVMYKAKAQTKRLEQEEEGRKARVRDLYPAPLREEETENGEG